MNASFAHGSATDILPSTAPKLSVGGGGGPPNDIDPSDPPNDNVSEDGAGANGLRVYPPQGVVSPDELAVSAGCVHLLDDADGLLYEFSCVDADRLNFGAGTS